MLPDRVSNPGPVPYRLRYAARRSCRSKLFPLRADLTCCDFLLASLDNETLANKGWGGGESGGAMVLGKLPVLGRPISWIIVGQGHTVLAVGAGGVVLTFFSLIHHFYLLFRSLWETARYRLKYCLKGPLSPKQPTNQSIYQPRSALE